MIARGGSGVLRGRGVGSVGSVGVGAWSQQGSGLARPIRCRQGAMRWRHWQTRSRGPSLLAGSKLVIVLMNQSAREYSVSARLRLVKRSWHDRRSSLAQELLSALLLMVGWAGVDLECATFARFLISVTCLPEFGLCALVKPSSLQGLREVDWSCSTCGNYYLVRKDSFMIR